MGVRFFRGQSSWVVSSRLWLGSYFDKYPATRNHRRAVMADARYIVLDRCVR